MTGCDASAANDPDVVMPDFTLHPMDTRLCDDIPAPRKWAYSTYFISKEPFTLNQTPENSPRHLTRGFLMYGGLNPGSGDAMDDLWLFDITNQDHGVCPWIKLENGLLDTPHYAGRMFYREKSRDVVIVGGYRVSGSTTESTSRVYTFNLERSIALGNVSVTQAAYSLNPQETYYHLLGDKGKETSDDGVFETDICGSPKPQACYDIQTCNALYSNDVDPCGSYTCPNGNAVDGYYGIYGACLSSLTCTTGASEQQSSHSLPGLAHFAAFYNPVAERFFMYGGSGGCKSSSPANCSRWDVFFPFIENPLLSTNRIFLKTPHYGDDSGLSLLHNPGLISFDYSGAVSIQNNVRMLYKESDASDDWLDDNWPHDDASLGLFKASVAYTGVYWDITRDQYGIDANWSRSVLLGGTFKQTLPPQWYFDFIAGDTFGICGQPAQQRVIPGMDFYHSKWVGFYEKEEPELEADYIHSVDIVDLNNPGALALHRVQTNDIYTDTSFDFRLTGAEIAPLVFTDKRGNTHYDFLVVGGRDVNGNLLDTPVHFGVDRVLGGSYVRRAPSVGGREGAVHIYDPVERANYIFGGTNNSAAFKLSLTDPGININQGRYVVQDAHITHKLYDAATPDTTDDVWTQRMKFDLQYQCDTDGCFTDQIALHLPNIKSRANVDDVMVNITLSDETDRCSAAPQTGPDEMLLTEDWCRSLGTPYDVSTYTEAGYESYVAHYKLPRPLANNETIKVTVTLNPDITISNRYSFDNIDIKTGFHTFKAGASGHNTSYGYLGTLPVVVAQEFKAPTSPQSMVNAWNNFRNNSPSFNLKTTFDLPAGYLGVASGQPNAAHREYTLTNPTENRDYTFFILEKGEFIKTQSIPSTDGGNSTIHLYSQSLPALTDLRSQYLDNPVITGGQLNASSLEHDTQRYISAFGSLPRKDVHMFYMAEQDTNNTVDGVNFRGGVAVGIAYEPQGGFVDFEHEGDRVYNVSVITSHELCHVWMADVVKADSWLNESLCTWMSINNDANKNYFKDYLKKSVDVMNEAFQHILSCAIQPGNSLVFFTWGSVYDEGTFVINQFFMALQGLREARFATQEDIWAHFRDNFLTPNRNRRVATEAIKAYFDSVLPPFSLNGVNYAGFYQDNIYYGCYHLPLLSIRDFNYTQNTAYAQDTPEAWNTAAQTRTYAVEQVHIGSTDNSYPRARNISYIPFYTSCMAHTENDADPSAPLEPLYTGCHEIQTLKGNRDVFQIQYQGQSTGMPVKMELLQLENLIDREYLAALRPENAQTFCGDYTGVITNNQGQTVNCIEDIDTDGFKQAEDCSPSLLQDTNNAIHPNFVEVWTTDPSDPNVDADCNCYKSGELDPDGIHHLERTCGHQ